ncbi:MAG: class I SAM-dependent methyltransferase [Bacteroidota bacterium]|nr:class I SAM-dependent methyltransferase [Bacteroidota bacterium]
MSNNNLKTYNSAAVVKWYEELDTITEVEKSVFENNKEIISSSNLLDIGIGGGRTTRYLIDKCKNYTGIDYSQGFVNSAKKKYPLADLRFMDARNLASFEENSFGFVNFSFNGIDYVNLDDRIKILHEINRVLKPGGVFFFSTHNKEHPSFNKFPWLSNINTFFTNLKTFLKLIPHLPKHFTQKRAEIFSEDYAIINDSAHNFKLLTFYTSSDFLKKQLTNAGFISIELLLKNGSLTTNNKLDDWIFVTCKKSLT